MTISYRDYEESHRESAKKIISAAFGLNKYCSGETLSVYEDTDIASCLLDSTFGRVAEDDGRVVGVILGNAACDVTPEIHRRTAGDLEKCFSKLRCRDPRGGLNFHKMNEAYDIMLSGREYDGTISTFAVLDDYKRKGIGSRLFDDLQAYQREKGVKKTYVFTDELCNYGFYDSRGFKRVAEGKVEWKNSEGTASRMAYLYEYKY